MKISIRFSILTILLTLLIGVSLIIIGINYFTVNEILIRTTKDTIENAGNKVGEQVSRYLQPLNNFSSVGADLIADNVVVPGHSITFVNFLHSIISDNKDIISAFWADAKGNFYLLGKETKSIQTEPGESRNLTSINIIKEEKNTRTIEDVYDSNMVLIDSKETTSASFDARLRPWYQQAKFEKRNVWLVYPLVYSEARKNALGITAVYPLYDKSEKLIGVFGMDMPLDVVSAFVESIKVTKNSVVFICDDQEHLITAYSSSANLLEGYKMPRLKDLGLAWAKESFDFHKESGSSVFTYRYGGKEYIASYGRIPDIKSEYKWNIAIVTPLQDIVEPLKQSIFFSFIFIFVALVIGIILSAIFSSRISKPIVKLAADAELICQLRLEEIKKVFSRIKEIAYMGDAFMKMKSALNSFQRYMPVALVKNLVSSGKVAEVGGDTEEITLLFSDIEGFTSVSENMVPQKVMQYLSEYFQVITNVIINTKGTVDKYIGDGAMAFWGAPIKDAQQAFHACQAAVQIKKDFVQLNNKWRSEGSPQAVTRIGINTGHAIVGNVGSDDRLSYTALGDEVNLASRLESLNKSYGTYVLVSESTYEIVKEHFNFRLVDRVAVKGKKQGVYVYELLGEKTASQDLQLEQYNKVFQEAFNLYAQGSWAKAQEIFSELTNKYPQDNLAQIFIKRCKDFNKNPPKDWSGVWVMEHK